MFESKFRLKFEILLFILVLLGMAFFSLNKNSRVQSKAFNTLLYSMLDHSVNEISTSEAHKNIDSFDFILDAREPNEFKVSHLKNAKNIGYNHFNIDALSEIPKESNILIYCSIGKRSENIAKQLTQNGFNNVHNLYGGIFEWKNQGYEVVNEDTITNKVHAYDKFFGIWLTNAEKVFD